MRITHVATSDMSLRYLLLDQLLYLRALGHDVRAVSGPGPWVRAVCQAGIPVHTVPLTRRIEPLADLRALGALVAHLARTRPDIVHTHTPKASLLGQWAAVLAAVRWRVHTVHGLYFPASARRRRWPYVWLERVLMAPAHIVLSQNMEDMDTIRRERIADARRVRFLGNGIDLERFAPTDAPARAAARAALGIPPDHAVVGMVGRLVAEKGYRELFAAAATVVAARPRTTFVAIGAPEPMKGDRIAPDDPEIAALGSHLRLLGHRDDMPALYGAMDVLALPSHREGFPRAPMEAAAAAVPSVVTNVRGCRDTVVDGETGLIVPVRDPAALTAAIIRVLGDDPLRARMGAAARRLAEERFDQRVVFRRVADAYDALGRS